MRARPALQEARSSWRALSARGRGTPPPRTSVRTARSVPALVLRLALLLLCLAAGVALTASQAQWWVLLVAGLLVAARPHAALVSLAAAVLVGMLAVSGAHPWQLPVLVLLTHSLLRLGALTDAVAWQGRVELGVLRDAVGGFLAVQAVAQAAAALALLLDDAAPVPWLTVLAVAGLGALGWALVRDLRA
ncbi:hypothetical protein FE251_04120 [Georgenia wutianyii]|uniref:Uncharacterized protein n=1 Tax=Georgenia wutianyii TaxID=2585135 RepID=A0ABX5VJU3_9MICO|nr:hypothetical protein [Georgenia wutianyii]QDB78654.1 hypothetical protein FE251_04120 [Georgenia wutianyii]